MNTKLILAIITVAIVWGTTFLTTKIAVETIPAWFVASLRQSLAALILLPILLFRKELQWIGWKNFKIQIILASLMLIGANGLTTLAQETLNSSLSSLLTALSPVMIYIISLIIGVQKYQFKSLVGIFLGLLGVGIIFSDGLEDLANPQYLKGIIILFTGITSWSLGTVYTKKIKPESNNILLNLFYQFSFAGLVQMGIAFAKVPNPNFENWSLNGILGIAYLGIFGSVITFFSYHYILTKLLPTQASMLSYVNTIIAIFLGWLILDETISAQFILSTMLIISGVFIMNYKKGMFKRKII